MTTLTTFIQYSIESASQSNYAREKKKKGIQNEKETSPPKNKQKKLKEKGKLYLQMMW